MNKGKKGFKYFVILIAPLFIFLFGLRSSAFAQLNPNSISLGFAPTALYLNLQPGEVYEGEATFWNLAPNTTAYSIAVRGFKQVEDFPGTARLETADEEERDPYSAAKWIYVEEESVNMASNEYYDLNFTVNVPDDAASGEFHAIINLVSEKGTQSSLGSAALADLGSGPVILINVGDDIDEKAEIEYFTTDKPFYEYPPVTFEAMYINKGNTHISPAGDIILTNIFGQEIDRIRFNSNQQSVLRGNSAVYREVWGQDNMFLFHNGKFAAGPIKAKLISTYRSVNPGLAPLSAVTSFWVLPWRILLLIIVVITAIILLATKRKEKIVYIEKDDSKYDPYKYQTPVEGFRN